MSEKLQPSKIDGSLSAQGLRFGIVVSRFNSFITDRLLAAAVDALERSGAGSKDVDVMHVPGSFELPLASKKLAVTGKYDALISIGCILRGETSHYDYVCSESRAFRKVSAKVTCRSAPKPANLPCRCSFSGT